MQILEETCNKSELDMFKRTSFYGRKNELDSNKCSDWSMEVKLTDL